MAAAAAACLAGATQLHAEDAAAILAAGDGFSVMVAALQPPEEGGAPGALGSGRGGLAGGNGGRGALNEEAAYHLVHAVALAARQPALQRRRDALEQLAAAIRRVTQCAGSGSLKQAAAEALAVLGQAAAGAGRSSYA